MQRIASPNELVAELQRLLAYSQTGKPSRVKLATELRGLADRVAATNRTAGYDILDFIIDQREIGDIYEKLVDEDDQSAHLFRDVIDKLNEVLDLDPRKQEALSRVIDIVKRGKNWDIALLRNNVFKAANALGINLPSGMF